MIAYVKGTLQEYGEEGIVLETGGIGYAISVPTGMLSELPDIGDVMKVYTYFQVTEDAQKLFGFRSREEKQLFTQLLKVSGIGPKLALSILSAVSPEELRLAVVTGDVKTLSRAPGLGKKTAEKLILELKDKVDITRLTAFGESRDNAAQPQVLTDVYTEAVEALMALGFSSQEALKAVRSADVADKSDFNEVLQAALQKLAAF